MCTISSYINTTFIVFLSFRRKPQTRTNLDFGQTPEEMRYCFPLYREIQSLIKTTDICNMKETIEKTIKRLAAESGVQRVIYKEHIRYAELKEILGEIGERQDRLGDASDAMLEAEKNYYPEEDDLDQYDNDLPPELERIMDMCVYCIECEMKITDILDNLICILNPQRQASRANPGEHPHNLDPTQYLLDSVDCFHRYIEFVRQAKSGKATLYIASAPGLSSSLLRAIIDTVKQDSPSRVSVNFYFRKNMINDAHVKSLLHESAKQFQQQIFISDAPQYFHTKWAAVVTEESDEVDLLLTSACLIDAHMTPDPDRPQKYNSMIVGRLPRTEFEQKFLNPMALLAASAICKPATIVQTGDNLVLEYQRCTDIEALSQKKAT